jgi:hypothetical protein
MLENLYKFLQEQTDTSPMAPLTAQGVDHTFLPQREYGEEREDRQELIQGTGAK